MISTTEADTVNDIDLNQNPLDREVTLMLGQHSSFGRPGSRRRFLQAGFLGLSLPRFLQLRHAVAASGQSSEPETSCIFIVLSGGLSHIDTLDPCPEAPREIRGPYEPIATALPGVQLSEKLPQLARIAGKYTLLRSLSHTTVPHVKAAHMMLTGQMDGSRSDNSPMMGSLISKFHPAESIMPSHVWLHNMKTGTNKVPRYNSGLDLIGYEYGPLRIGHELDNPAEDSDFRVRAFDPAEGLSRGRLKNRFALLDSLESGAKPVETSETGRRFRQFQERAFDLIHGPQARRAFNLGQETKRMRDRYGRHPLGQYCLMARRLIEAEVPLVTVTGWPGLAPGETKPTVTQVWDTHDIRYKAGESMYGDGPFGMKWALPRLDQAVAALIEDLDDRGLLETTLVVLLSEFGRTPKFGPKNRGREHWPACYSGLLAGGGIRRGFLYGASDRRGAYVASGSPISPADFGATLFSALGIPPETRYGPDGFSLRLSDGTVVRELFES